jgi:hypothetical protein
MQKKFHESFLQAVALHLYRDDPEVLNCYNVLFYNHCIELTPFFFLFTGGYGQVNFECNLFSLFLNTFTNSFYFLCRKIQD